jgi:diaminopimelate epimerase
MHGLGNDFVVLDARGGGARLSEDAVRAVGDRRRGVGFDQLLTIEPSTRGDAFMRIHNPDGSESGACGNGTRCVAALLMDESGRDSLTIETRAGLLRSWRNVDGAVTVDMGKPRLDWRDIPLARAMDTLRLDYAMGALEGPAAVNMGNPHVVFFVPDAEAIDLPALGPRVETDPLFPERTNVNVASRRADGSLRLRVWERGAGITAACGSGACATLVAAARRGIVKGRKAVLHLNGGPLTIEWSADDSVLMTGPVATSFAGTLSPDLVGA